MSNPNTAIVPVGDSQGLKALAEMMKPQIAQILPRHVTPERIVKSLMLAASRQPALLQCTRMSIMKSLMEASELGLDCAGGTLGQGYLVPFWNNKIKAKEATFIPGYRGLIDLARRAGSVKRVEAEVVYKGDVFECQRGLEPRLRHVPSGNDNPDDITHAYMIAWFDTGEAQFEVMTRPQLDGVMARSKSKDREGNSVGPWVTDFAEMARKTVVRRGIKYLPLSSELMRAVELADGNEFGMKEAAGELIEIQAPTPEPEEEAPAPPPKPGRRKLTKEATTEPKVPEAQAEPEPQPPPAEPPTADQVLNYENVVAHLTRTAGCDEMAAKEAIFEWSIKTLKTAPRKLSTEQLDQLLQAIEAGQLTPKASE